MQSKEILSAILATIAYLESVQAVPVAAPEPSSNVAMPHFRIGTTVSKVPIGDESPMDIFSVPSTGNINNVARAPETETREVDDKRSPLNWVKLGEDGLEGLVGGAASSTGKSLATEAIDGVESLVSNIARAPEKQAREVDGKRSPVNWVKLGESGLENLVGGAASSTGKSLATEAIDGVESLVSNIARAPEKQAREVDGKRSPLNWVQLGESGLESLVGGAATATGSSLASEVESGVESLVSNFARAPMGDTDFEKRKFSLGKSSKGGKTSSSGKTSSESTSTSGSSSSSPEQGSSSGSGSSTTSGIIGALGSEGGTLLVDGVKDAWKSLESHIARAPPSAPARRDPSGSSLLTAGLKGLGTGALKVVGEDVWDDISNDFKRSTGTTDAPMAARSGVWDEILHYGEEAAPIALGLLDDVKRSPSGSKTDAAPKAARSGIWDEILHYGEEAAPIALGILDDVKRSPSGSKTDDAPMAARSGIWGDIEEGLGIAGKFAAGLLEEE